MSEQLPRGVRLLGSGAYQGRYQAFGKRHSKSFSTPEQAGAWVKTQEMRYSPTELTAASPWPDLVELFLNMPRRRRRVTNYGTSSERSDRTVEKYESKLRLYATPFFKKMQLGDIDLTTILRYQSWVEDEAGDYLYTLALAQDITKWTLDLAVRMGAKETNPFDHPRVIMPAYPQGRDAVEIDDDELDRLIDVTPFHYKTAVFATSYLGMRAGELWALRRRNINELHKELTIDSSVAEIKSKGLVMGPPKGGKPRTISVPEDVMTMLIAQAERVNAGPDDWLFPSPKGFQVRHHNFSEDVWRPSLKEAKMPVGMVFHDLRHYCVHYHITLGFDLYAIKELVGHSSIKMTADIYGGMFRRTRQENAEKVNQALRERAQRAHVMPTNPVELHSMASK